MPVRLRITLLFSLLVFIILSLVCSVIYYISAEGRTENIANRLRNRAITTARLLSQREIFDQTLIRQIDSLTTLSLKNKVVQAYDEQNRLVYRYSDVPGDTMAISAANLASTRQQQSLFFRIGHKEIVAYHYTDGTMPMVIVVAAEDVNGKEQLGNLLRILLLSFLIGNILVLIAGYYFSRRLLRPIRRISDDVAEISAQNLARRIDAGKTNDEWHQLSSTLNELLNRLQHSFDMQRRFIANASHELSTPLTAISSQLEVTLHKERSAAEYKKVMQSIYQDVQQLNRLTQTLLEFAKASGDPGGLEINLIRIDEVILNIPSEIIKSFPGGGVKINFDEMPEQEENLLVFGNEALLFTALKNIVFNACKYADDHRASITLRIAGSQIFISVSDNGPGIPEAEIERIFQPFYRLAETRKPGGFGLGLSLANRIIKIHKGQIEVQSAPGKGTTFTIILPSAKTLKAI